MRCDEAQEAMQDWLDDPACTLGPDVSAHLGDCRRCREFARSWTAIEVGLRRIKDEAPEPSGFLASRVQEAVRRSALLPATRLCRWWRVPRSGVAAAAFVALVLLLVWVGRSLSRTSAMNPLGPSAPMAATR